jgi:PIN domain nuclease of toxin-antitoxin system
MPDAVTDTHALIWYLQDDRRLSVAAGACFDDCQTDGGRIRVPSICVVEIVYLSEKHRIPIDTLSAFLIELAAADTILQFAELDLSTVLALQRVPRATIPELADRIIAATAVSLGLPLISRDAAIRASGLTTIW